jgi:hypothetical protein
VAGYNLYLDLSHKRSRLAGDGIESNQ